MRILQYIWPRLEIDCDSIEIVSTDLLIFSRMDFLNRRKSGFQMDEVDEQEIEEYYRNRYSSLHCVL